MKLIEIHTKYFFTDEKALALLESYFNPDNDLTIKYSPSENSKSTWYVNVFETNTNIPVLEVMFTLREGIFDIGNIMPADHPAHTKLVHTSLGVQYNGVDMGTTSVRWLFRKLKEFASTKGFDIKKIVSSTRYTGARAKNNQGADEVGLPKSFNVSAPVKESLTYTFDTDEFEFRRSD
jgi:hypothetical protein